MENSVKRDGGKRGRNALNMVVNVTVLLFLGYALLRSDSPLRTKIREYASARAERVAAHEILDGLASQGRVDSGRPTIIEFTDFQCPYCRDMHDVLRHGSAENEFHLVVMHFPLEQIHPLARPAAKASLCGQAQRSGKKMNHLLMSTRDWMDDTDWGRLAHEAGVPDLKRFEECMDAPDTELELARHAAIAKKIGVRGTPTFVSYGGVHRSVASLEELVKLAKK